MKKFTILTVLLSYQLLLFAQPALTWVKPPYGTTKTYNMYSGSLTEPTVGANQVWDYSTLSATNIGAGVYTDPATLPASAKDKFPTATYVEVWTSPISTTLDKAIIDYYYDCADSLVRLGQQSSGGSNFSTWGDVQAVWNIDFGSSANARYMDPSTGQLVLGSYTYAGYGTLKTKYGTYDNVVMISRPGAKTFFQTSPYFGILMNVMYSSSNTIAGAYIYSYGTASAINELKTKNNVSVFSTQKNNEIIVNIENFRGLCNVKIYDLQGKIVFENALQFNSDKQRISLESNLTGIYMCEINYDNFTHREKILVSR